MWQLKTARDLTPKSLYVVKEAGAYRSSARIVGDTVDSAPDAVTFTARPRWSRTPTDEPVTLTPDQPVYILKCTCNGMAFIGSRRVFTGECSCVHHDLPKDA